MPGITGIIGTQPDEAAERDLARMVAAMRHDNSYRGGTYVNQECGLYVGWMFQNGTSSNRMPLINENRDVVMIFQGESYATDESSHGIPISASTAEPCDAHGLLRLYEENGEDFVRLLNGWFCGVVADLRNRRIILFNDRYGMSRLYVYEANNEILFGSEAKSLLRVRSQLRAIDPQALAQFLRCDCVLGNKSLLKNVSLLPAGSLWSFDDRAAVKKRRYFEFTEWEQQDALEPTEFYERFVSSLNRIVPRYARDMENIALSLTAGLDTRVIMASLHEQDRSFPCYTFGGAWGETYDIRTARKLARIYNQPYQAITINGNFFNGFPTFAEKSVYLSDGALDAFSAHDVYFNEIAREIAPVRLTGKYGSEIVRVRKIIPFSEFPETAVASELKPFLEAVPHPNQLTEVKHPLSRVVSEEIPWYAFGRLAVEQSQLAVRTPYMDNDLVKLMFQAPSTLRSTGELQARYITDRGPVISRFPTNMGKLGANKRLSASFLYRLNWALFKTEYIYLYATPHWLTRVDRSLGSWHPERLLTGRQKFEMYRIWIKTHFASFIRETLLNPQADYTRYFDYRSISKMVKRHTAGTHNYLNEINKALTIELVCSSLLKR